MTLDPSQKPFARGRTADIFAWDDGRVLKLYQTWMTPETIRNEANKTRIVHSTGLPVPAVYETLQVGDRWGTVFERIEGGTMLQAFMKQPWKLGFYARHLAELHARMHTCRAEGLPDAVGMNRWKIEHAHDLADHYKTAALALLERMPGGDAVLHGDFHPDNILYTPNGPVIIDWDNLTTGNPLADVARTCILLHSTPPGISALMRWAFNRVGEIMETLYLRRYFELRPASSHELSQWMPVIAAARLSEYIPEDQPFLLQTVRRLDSML